MRHTWMTSVDPSVLEAVFPERSGAWASPEESAEERMLPEAEAPEEEPSVGWDVMEPLLTRLPPAEADYCRLYYRDGLTQTQIGSVVGLTQAAVSYRLARARRRLQFLRVLPELDPGQFELDLHFLRPAVRDVLRGCYETTCQSLVAARLGTTQGAVRSRFQTGMRQVSHRIRTAGEDAAYLARRAGEDPEAASAATMDSHRLVPYVRAFVLVSEHWNILHQIDFPWQERTAVIITVDSCDDDERS